MSDVKVSDLIGFWNVVESEQGDVIGTALAFELDVNKFDDKKLVDDGEGYNIIRGKRRGYFSVTVEGDELILNYSEQNVWPLCKVVDRLRKDGDAWEGVLYLRGIAMFAFRLERVVGLLDRKRRKLKMVEQRVKCDHCGRSTDWEEGHLNLPEGWYRVGAHDLGAHVHSCCCSGCAVQMIKKLDNLEIIGTG